MGTSPQRKSISAVSPQRRLALNNPQTGQNAPGDASAASDAFGQVLWRCQSRFSSIAARRNALTDTLLFRGEETPRRAHTRRTQWCYRRMSEAPTTIGGSEIGNRYFQQLPDVSGDSEPDRSPLETFARELAGIQFNDSAFVIQPGITGALSFWFLALRGREYYPGMPEFPFFFILKL